MLYYYTIILLHCYSVIASCYIESMLTVKMKMIGALARGVALFRHAAILAPRLARCRSRALVLKATHHVQVQSATVAFVHRLAPFPADAARRKGAPGSMAGRNADEGSKFGWP